jgi:hypothetical protein
MDMLDYLLRGLGLALVFGAGFWVAFRARSQKG